MKLVIINWRNKRTINEISGGNTRRQYLVNLIAEILRPSEIEELTVEVVDSIQSRAFAAAGKVLETTPARGIAPLLREIRFGLVSCKELERATENAVTLVDHARGLYMIHKCRLRPRALIALLHDYHLEFPYGHKSLLFFKNIIDRIIINNLQKINLIIVASERDALLYRERINGISILLYPNLYYPYSKINIKKSIDHLILNLVTPRCNINKVQYYIDKLRSFLPDIEIRAYSLPRDLRGVVHMGSIPSRTEYLEKLAEGHIGLNMLCEKQTGSNVKRYDYAIAATVPFSYKGQVLGEPLPHEYAFADPYDLAAKIKSLDLETLIHYGNENAEYVYQLHLKYKAMLERALKDLVGRLE